MHYRAIFISDLHLGTPGCQADALLDFLKLIIDKDGKLAIARDDDIVQACLVCEGGQNLRKK